MHLAAESHVDRSIAGPADFIHTNIVERFICWKPAAAPGTATTPANASTTSPPDEVYGSLGPTGCFTETTPTRPIHPSGEQGRQRPAGARYYHTYGLPAVITNCSNNYGPYQFPESSSRRYPELAGSPADPGLWRWPECARLALRARSCGSALAGDYPRPRRRDLQHRRQQPMDQLRLVELICDPDRRTGPATRRRLRAN